MSKVRQGRKGSKAARWVMRVVPAVVLTAAMPAFGATIFSDNFEGRCSSSSCNSVGNSWIELAASASDVALVRTGSQPTNYAMLLRDNRSGTTGVTNPDASGTQLALSTVGFSNIKLQFNWKPLTVSESTDKLWASYNYGSGWRNLGPLSLGGSGDWQSASFNLLSAANNTEPFRIRLWTDVSSGSAGDSEGALVDNVRLSGTPIVTAVPEPEIYAMLAMGFGVLTWVGRRRKQSVA
jgi:hypothetical protein